MIHRTISLVCVGDHDCGKSTLLRCLGKNGQSIEPEDVFLFDHETIEVPVDSVFTSLVTIKNTSGKETLDSMRRDALVGAEGVLACFSLADSRTLESLTKKWIPEVRTVLGSDVPIVLIGTKSDIRAAILDEDANKRTSKRMVPVQSKEADAVSRKFKLAGYHEVSAREGKGVKDAIVDLLRAATMYKIKQDGQRLHSNGSSPSSPASSPKPGFISRLLHPNRNSTKTRLSQRLLEVAAEGQTAEALDLLSKGAHASWSAVDTKSSPLHAAAKAGNTDILNVLLYAGGDVKLKDANGATPLHVACCNGHFDCAKALLDRGADVNVKNLVESTPLHDAAGAGARDIVMLLLERGADENLRDMGGHTASERAAIAGFPMLFYKEELVTGTRSSLVQQPIVQGQ